MCDMASGIGMGEFMPFLALVYVGQDLHPGILQME
jgi:hypothetical protein